MFTAVVDASETLVDKDTNIPMSESVKLMADSGSPPMDESRFLQLL